MQVKKQVRRQSTVKPTVESVKQALAALSFEEQVNVLQESEADAVVSMRLDAQRLVAFEKELYLLHAQNGRPAQRKLNALIVELRDGDDLTFGQVGLHPKVVEMYGKPMDSGTARIRYNTEKRITKIPFLNPALSKQSMTILSVQYQPATPIHINSNGKTICTLLISPDLRVEAKIDHP